jgi:hypothetical protein
LKYFQVVFRNKKKYTIHVLAFTQQKKGHIRSHGGQWARVKEKLNFLKLRGGGEIRSICRFWKEIIQNMPFFGGNILSKSLKQLA